MKSATKKLRKFHANVLFLPKDIRKRHVQKVLEFIKLLRPKVNKLPGVKIKNFVIAGSIAKKTILKRTNKKPIDVDLLLITAKQKKAPTQKELIGQINKLLSTMYKNKNNKDFKVKSKATTATFRTSGLDIDVVPALEVENKPKVADQYEAGKRKPIRTCASCQIKLIKEYRRKDPDFRVLVRLAKKWRDNAKLTPLKSYTIELIMAYLLKKRRLQGDLEEKFMAFLQYLAESKLKKRISFRGAQSNEAKHDGPVVIVDPFCNSNNVAKNIKADDRRWIVNKATKACNIHKMASDRNDAALWKRIFGPEFSDKNLK